MRIHRGIHHRELRELAAAGGCALTIGNFDGVHRGHQAMLALLTSEARHRGLPSCVLTFEPHPRDFFAARSGRAGLAPARIATLRDKLAELRRCGIDRTVVLRFDARLAALTPAAFVDEILLAGLGARYVLVGDDFRYGAQRAGDYATLDAAGDRLGFDVARMLSYEVHGERVSSSAVRAALAAGDMARAAALLGRPYAISGHVVHGARLGRRLGESAPGAGDGFRTLNLRFAHRQPAAGGIFVVRTHGLGAHALPGVANLGVRPGVDDSGRVLLEVHCLEWPAGLGEAYGRVVQVELLHKLRDERRYPDLAALRAGIAADVAQARQWWAAQGEAVRAGPAPDRATPAGPAPLRR